MFQEGGKYQNRIGTYIVLSMGPQKMKVRYDDGSEADLNINIQHRIWENIQADLEVESMRSRNRTAGPHGNYYIRSVKLLSDEDVLTAAAVRALVAPTSKNAPPIAIGDRFIYYSVGAKSFFAISTITEDADEASAKEFVELDFDDGEELVDVYELEIDAFAPTMEQAAHADNVELESQPKFKQVLTSAEIYLPVSEDDFEMLAELLVEYVEGSDLDDDLDEEDDLDADDVGLLDEEDLLLEDDLDID